MQTEAVFENIAERIQQEISKAQKSVFIAVAWFTNKILFNELINEAKKGAQFLSLFLTTISTLIHQLILSSCLLTNQKFIKLATVIQN